MYEQKFYSLIIFMGLSAPCHFREKSIECAHIQTHLDVKRAFIPTIRGHFGKHRSFFPCQFKLGSWKHAVRTMKYLKNNPIIPCYSFYNVCLYLFICLYNTLKCMYICVSIWYCLWYLKMLFYFLKTLTRSLYWTMYCHCATSLIYA